MYMHYRNSQLNEAYCYQVKKDYYSNMKVHAYYLRVKEGNLYYTAECATSAAIFIMIFFITIFRIFHFVTA